MIPPAFMRIHVAEGGKRGFRLWLPLLLLWPLFLLAGLVALPFALLAGLISRSGRRASLLLKESYLLCCALRGLQIDVNNSESTVKIYFW